jgi:hypothetical protein
MSWLWIDARAHVPLRQNQIRQIESKSDVDESQQFVALDGFGLSFEFGHGTRSGSLNCVFSRRVLSIYYNDAVLYSSIDG